MMQNQLRANAEALVRRVVRNAQTSSSTSLVVQVAIAAGSVYLLAKLLRALAHYAFPR